MGRTEPLRENSPWHSVFRKSKKDLLDGGNGEFHEGHQEGAIETGIRR